MYVLWRTLQFRNKHCELFDSGNYEPIAVSGEKAPHVCAFARRSQDSAAVIIAPRLVYGLCGGKTIPPTGEIWGNTELGADTMSLRNVFTDEIVVSNRLADVFNTFPIALLARS